MKKSGPNSGKVQHLVNRVRSFHHPGPTSCRVLRKSKSCPQFWGQFLPLAKETPEQMVSQASSSSDSQSLYCAFFWWQHTPGTSLSPQRESDPHLLQYISVPILTDSLGRNNRFTCQLQMRRQRGPRQKRGKNSTWPRW